MSKKNVPSMCTQEAEGEWYPLKWERGRWRQQITTRKEQWFEFLVLLAYSYFERNTKLQKYEEVV